MRKINPWKWATIATMSLVAPIAVFVGMEPSHVCSASEDAAIAKIEKHMEQTRSAIRDGQFIPTKAPSGLAPYPDCSDHLTTVNDLRNEIMHPKSSDEVFGYYLVAFLVGVCLWVCLTLISSIALGLKMLVRFGSERFSGSDTAHGEI